MSMRRTEATRGYLCGGQSFTARNQAPETSLAWSSACVSSLCLSKRDSYYNATHTERKPVSSLGIKCPVTDLCLSLFSSLSNLPTTVPSTIFVCECVSGAVHPIFFPLPPLPSHNLVCTSSRSHPPHQITLGPPVLYAPASICQPPAGS